MAGEPTFLEFGPYGKDFQKLHENVWAYARTLWNALQDSGMSLPPFEKTLAEELNLRNCLFKMLFQLTGQTGVSELMVMDTWKDLRLAFSPSLADGSELAMHHHLSDSCCAFLAVVEELYNDPALADERVRLNQICYGPFRGDEVDWVRHNYPRIIELGGGNGYSAYQMLQAGIDVVSLDNDRYKWLSRYSYSWTAELLANGRLIIITDLDQFAKYIDGRALLIVAPEPGSSFPADALEMFTAAGGTDFLFKFRGFTGARQKPTGSDYVPPENFVQNVFKFFHVLARDCWYEVTDPNRPTFLPEYESFNLLAFKRAVTY